MQLYLLRHGVAGQHGDSKYPNDADRPLTKKGRRKLHAQLAGLKAFKVKPDVILASPFVRARQTAEIIAEGLGLNDRLVSAPALASGCTPEDILNLLLSYPDSLQVMMVGHEPDFSHAAAVLCGGSGDIWLRKGGLVRIDFESPAKGHGVLYWLLEPKHLMLDAGDEGDDE